MNRDIKSFFARLQKQSVAVCCVAYALFLGVSGCHSAFEENTGKPATSHLRSAESPYYFYNHERQKVYLSLNTQYAFLSVREPTWPEDIVQRGIKSTKFKPDKADKFQYREKPGPRRYYARLSIEEDLTDEQYVELLADIKRKNPEVIISPYFKKEDGISERIGISNFFYVKLKDEKDVGLLEQMAEQTGSIVIEQDAFMPLWFLLSVTEASELNALESAIYFYESGLFEAGEPDVMVVNIKQCAGDDFFDQQWGLNNTGQSGGTSGIDIQACDAWDLSTGEGVIVAVIDDGIELDHPDLYQNILYYTSFDCIDGTSQTYVRGPHGTACAGIIGAVKDNTIGIAGIAPDCSLMAICHSLLFEEDPHDPEPEENLTQKQLAAGINWAWSNGADVISCSWGNNDLDAGDYILNAIYSAVTYGRGGLGCVLVFAAGNYNTSVIFPANVSNVIAVGAINRYGQRWIDGPLSGSCIGINLNVVAPGIDIYTTDRQNSAGYSSGDYAYFNCTSAATLHVSGIAALILSKYPQLTYQQVQWIIESSCTKIDSYYTFSQNVLHPNGTWNSEVGHGLVNAYEAVVAAGALVAAGGYFTVSFDLNGGLGALPAKQNVIKNGYAAVPSTDPTRTNYVFVGWNTSPAGTGSDIAAHPITSNQTFYAQWGAVPGIDYKLINQSSTNMYIYSVVLTGDIGYYQGNEYLIADHTGGTTLNIGGSMSGAGFDLSAFGGIFIGEPISNIFLEFDAALSGSSSGRNMYVHISIAGEQAGDYVWFVPAGGAGMSVPINGLTVPSSGRHLMTVTFKDHP